MRHQFWQATKQNLFGIQIQTGEDEMKRSVWFSPPHIDKFNKAQ